MQRVLSTLAKTAGIAFTLAFLAASPASAAAVYSQLSDDNGLASQFGYGASVSLKAGQTFGFYITSTDGDLGRALGFVYADFVGQFAGENWVLDVGAGDGSGGVYLTELDLYGNDNDLADITTSFSVTVTTDTTFEFDWRYLTYDIDGPQYDRFGYFVSTTETPTDVPAPAALSLFALGAVGLMAGRRRRAA